MTRKWRGIWSMNCQTAIPSWKMKYSKRCIEVNSIPSSLNAQLSAKSWSKRRKAPQPLVAVWLSLPQLLVTVNHVPAAELLVSQLLTLELQAWVEEPMPVDLMPPFHPPLVHIPDHPPSLGSIRWLLPCIHPLNCIPPSHSSPCDHPFHLYAGWSAISSPRLKTRLQTVGQALLPLHTVASHLRPFDLPSPHPNLCLLSRLLLVIIPKKHHPIPDQPLCHPSQTCTPLTPPLGLCPLLDPSSPLLAPVLVLLQDNPNPFSPLLQTHDPLRPSKRKRSHLSRPLTLFLLLLLNPDLRHDILMITYLLQLKLLPTMPHLLHPRDAPLSHQSRI